jgi:hypothetical protein
MRGVGFAHQFTSIAYPIPGQRSCLAYAFRGALADELRLSVPLQKNRSEYDNDHQYNGIEQNHLCPQSASIEVAPRKARVGNRLGNSVLVSAHRASTLQMTYGRR